MADKKITELTANAAPAETDIGVLVDDPGGSPITQKATLINLARVGRDYGVLHYRAVAGTSIVLTPTVWSTFNLWDTAGEDRGIITADAANNRLVIASTSATVIAGYSIGYSFTEAADSRSAHYGRMVVSGTPIMANGDDAKWSDATTVSPVYSDIERLVSTHIIAVSSNPTYLTVEMTCANAPIAATTVTPYLNATLWAIRL